MCCKLLSVKHRGRTQSKNHRAPVFLTALALTIALYLGATGHALAHGSGWSQERAFSVVLSFYYADQTPIAYAEVEIFSPADSQIPYQKGRSDRNGFFSFRPDTVGQWSFSAADGQGHLSKGEVAVTAEQLSPTPVVAPTEGQSEAIQAASPEPSPPLAKGGASAEGIDPLKIILGISLITNLGLIFLRRRKSAV